MPANISYTGIPSTTSASSTVSTTALPTTTVSTTVLPTSTVSTSSTTGKTTLTTSTSTTQPQSPQRGYSTSTVVAGVLGSVLVGVGATYLLRLCSKKRRVRVANPGVAMYPNPLYHSVEPAGEQPYYSTVGTGYEPSSQFSQPDSAVVARMEQQQQQQQAYLDMNPGGGMLNADA